MHPILHKRRFSSAQIILMGFAAVILLGAWLLMLPISSRDGSWTPFLDTLFTSTSAVCVTGLVLYDTATHWTLFGQVVILLLIQIGGMGVITVAASIAMLSGRKITLSQRSTMQDAISAPQVGGIVRFTGFVLKGICLVEFTGAAFLSIVFIRDYGFFRGIWMGLFHSISAFCNAGFDLLGEKAPFSSLTAYVTDPIINLAIGHLIIIGGIGFLTWEDVCRNKWHFGKYRMQSKVILVATLLLITIPALYFFFFEFEDLPFAQRAWGSWFQSVTPRTAGFNTLNYGDMSEVGQIITSMLMVIGGAPGSTAGGMKNTTFAVLIACAVAVFQKRQDGHYFGRRLSTDTVKNAVAIFLLYICTFLLGGMVISRIENLPLITTLFESASAVGTVGLTVGITPSLGTVSKVVLIMEMFFGRVGGLTLIFATIPAAKNLVSRLPEEKIAVG